MMYKYYLNITMIAVIGFISMLYGFLGMCGVNAHIYGLVALVGFVTDAYLVNNFIDNHDKEQAEDDENEED